MAVKKSKQDKNRDWETFITEPIAHKIFEALSNHKFDFRTINGISKETNLSNSRVKKILLKYPHLVRKSAIPDYQGHGLFTLRSKPISSREGLAVVRTFLSKSVD